MNGPFDLYLFLANNPPLLMLSMAITACIMAAKS